MAFPKFIVCSVHSRNLTGGHLYLILIPPQCTAPYVLTYLVILRLVRLLRFTMSSKQHNKLDKDNSVRSI